MPEPCYICGEPSADKWAAHPNARPTCYAHCSVTQTGEHTPHWGDSTLYSEGGTVQIGENNTIIVDVPCSACGQSGSIAISIVGPDSEIQWV